MYLFTFIALLGIINKSYCFCPLIVSISIFSPNLPLIYTRKRGASFLFYKCKTMQFCAQNRWSANVSFPKQVDSCPSVLSGDGDKPFKEYENLNNCIQNITTYHCNLSVMP